MPIAGLLARLVVSVGAIGGGGLFVEKNSETYKPSKLLGSAESAADQVSKATPITNFKGGWNEALLRFQEAVYQEWVDVNTKNQKECEQRLIASLQSKGYEVVSLKEA
eukprot:CAMPEP_0174286832 /NCGR_PEP_ID=MMETSP0809-20121228/13271_1 /TAXON_ID=73025 ORGANISM="Eutreptiella gymnastica-like, Strain CCMP1594" /NCGR_SAMPLE_ID=MMETSP0809 /ASSEMBLY_ACC=CAM_ASM_000658 /LENGTH=107 /DNA_ID=CAMNT_0015383059 /DNA_START=42 /DNA_END=365 /DNA_ORIENTATION=+